MEKQAKNICSLPVSCIGYFDKKEQLDDIFIEISRKFPNIQYMYIYHLGDTDDLKDHYHILIRNHTDNGKINVNSLVKYFEKEYAGKIKSYLFNAEFRQCKSVYSWYKYVLHDIDYLASKGEFRNIHYRHNDIFTNSQGWLEDISTYKPYGEKSQFDLCCEYINQGLTDFEILQKMQLSLTEINLAYKGLEIIRKML